VVHEQERMKKTGREKAWGYLQKEETAMAAHDSKVEETREGKGVTPRLGELFTAIRPQKPAGWPERSEKA